MDDPEGDGPKTKKKAAKKKEAAPSKDKEGKAEPEPEKVEENEAVEAVEPPRHAKGTHQYEKEVHKA